MMCRASPPSGRKRPKDVPTTIRGKPMPRAKANKTPAPTRALPDCEMNNKAPTNAGVTQGETITADRAPKSAAPPIFPCLILLLSAYSFWRQGDGNSNLNQPNMPAASSTKIKANGTISCGF